MRVSYSGLYATRLTWMQFADTYLYLYKYMLDSPLPATLCHLHTYIHTNIHTYIHTLHYIAFRGSGTYLNLSFMWEIFADAGTDFNWISREIGLWERGMDCLIQEMFSDLLLSICKWTLRCHMKWGISYPAAWLLGSCKTSPLAIIYSYVIPWILCLSLMRLLWKNIRKSILN
jgi:hypothetical protein